MPEYQFTVTETVQRTVITTRDSLAAAKEAYLEDDVRSLDYAVTERLWTDITADGQPIADDLGEADDGYAYQVMEFQQFLRGERTGD
ncbi:hypothetical protein ACFQ80_06060 [Isoptericola sp. NPDC056578]|uniref:hypothetical protein n=1 Tax=Isoptericola sp. NPDC056578 TaxID=3345870 RepID=UPI0036A57129